MCVSHGEYDAATGKLLCLEGVLNLLLRDAGVETGRPSTVAKALGSVGYYLSRFPAITDFLRHNDDPPTTTTTHTVTQFYEDMTVTSTGLLDEAIRLHAWLLHTGAPTIDPFSPPTSPLTHLTTTWDQPRPPQGDDQREFPPDTPGSWPV